MAEYIFDSRKVAMAENVRLELGAVEKYSQNPLFSEEFFADPPKKWEARFDNVYPTVLFDEEEGIFQALVSCVFGGSQF